ncbi:MAG TPA: ChbG/HpnK family deacetylase [Vicinamibacteria bacterium]|nr:ChbG/HpnK family deacetylase [Vicinamibacteria bacterium]
MTRKLIVSGDDLGLHEAINRGVLEAHEEGIVTSASIVPCGRAFEHACRLVERRRKIGLGIHLTLVGERPLLGPNILKTLAPKGELPKGYRQLFFGLLKGRIDPEEIELELDAQIQRVMKAGLAISHLDSHQHTHFFPQIRKTLFRLAEHYEIRGLRAGGRVVPARTKFTLLLAPLAKGVQRAARSRGIRTPDTLWLPSPSGRITSRDLIAGIPKLPAGVTELVVHPGVDQKALEREYPAWGFNWQQELAAIKATDVRDMLARHNVQLTRYSELG